MSEVLDMSLDGVEQLSLSKFTEDAYLNYSMYVIMDRAYEGDETRPLVLDLGCIPVVPPKSNRRELWDYGRHLYKKRNEVERLFRRLKGFRRIFTRFDKLDVVFAFFIHFALIADALISVSTP